MARIASRRPWGVIWLAALVAASVAALFYFSPFRRDAPGSETALSLSAELPDSVPPGVVLRVGDPTSEWVLKHNGWERELPFKVEWAQITGGPEVTEAFHAKALDVGLGANVPPIHATWMGIPVKIIGFRQAKEPLDHPAFVFGISPKASIPTLADLRGKRIALSPSQVQGQIVFKTLELAGLKPADVKLVELPSSIGGDVYTNALASGVIDAAPIGAGIVAERYVRKFGSDGARILRHAPFRDDPVMLFVPVEVLQQPGKAAALKRYVEYWGRAQRWIDTHREEFARGYYGKHQGLPVEDGRLILRRAGPYDLPRDWAGAIAYQQAAIDLLAPRMKHPGFDAASLFDRRFETIAADAFQRTPQ